MADNQILILKNTSAKELSKLQRQFNLNVQKINDLKEQIEATKEQLRTIQTRVHDEIIPLQHQHTDILVKLVYLFDKHYDDSYFKKKEKEKLADFILNKSHDLISHAGRDELKVIYDKYSDNGTFDELNEETDNLSAEMMKSMMENMMGIQFDEEVDVSSPEKMAEYVQQKIQEQQAAEEERRAHRKKTDKQLEKEEKMREESKNVSKAARAIYTDLVKEFHPDRERDDAEKQRKTDIMHRITEAYENNDLFTLLKLKIELQSDDIEQLTMADEQLKYYNKILREQVKELEEQLYIIQTGGELGEITGMNLYQKFGGETKTMKAKITREKNRIKQNIRALEEDMKALSIKENMRSFLKTYYIQNNDDFIDFNQFFR